MFANDLASASAGASGNAAALHYLSTSLLQFSTNFCQVSASSLPNLGELVTGSLRAPYQLCASSLLLGLE